MKVGAGISETLPGYRLPAGCYRSTASGEAHKDGQTATQSASTSEYCISAPTGPGGGGDLETCDHCDGSNIEPLVLDLNGDGIWTTSKDDGAVWFDLNGNGLPDLTAWTSGDHEDAFLYFDWNDNKIIDGGQELFGDATILPDGRRASHGYEALAAYDDPEFGGNADGVISRADAVWPRLRLWVDRNHDAMVSNDENSTLAAAGVVELSLAYVQMTAAENYGLDANGNRHLYQGSFAQKVRGETHRQSMHELYFVADLH